MNTSSKLNQRINKDLKMEVLLIDELRKACRKIAPVWSLENAVAVNPYLGMTSSKFDDVAQQLNLAGNIQMTLPISFYLNKMESGDLRTEHIESALRSRKDINFKDVNSFIEDLKSLKAVEKSRVLTVSSLASELTGKDWSRFVMTRISSWAASYFDKGQAVWKARIEDSGLFEAWKFEASIDLTPRINGLVGFRKFIKGLPDDSISAAKQALEKLNIPEEGLEIYLHSLLLSYGGWAAYAAQLDWENGLRGKDDGKLIDFLSILLSWEATLLDTIQHENIKDKWIIKSKTFSLRQQSLVFSERLVGQLILQDAFDLAAQEELIGKLNKSSELNSQNKKTEPKVQAIFCIDVRSEVFRRHLEKRDAGIETLGFAGFFGFPLEVVPLGHSQGRAQCPALLAPSMKVEEEIENRDEQEVAFKNRLQQHHTKSIWKTFKSGAITCFGFVSPMGLSFLPKLFSDSFGLTRPVQTSEEVGLTKKQIASKSIRLEMKQKNKGYTGIPFEQQVSTAKNALAGMSLTKNFAEFVLIVGHGSSTVNNPHATGLDCGACGGHSGEVNAKVAAKVLNSERVRLALIKEGIEIPQNTVFLSCLHNTTTDEITIFNAQDISANQQIDLDKLKDSLSKAGKDTRNERLAKMPNTNVSDADKSVINRSKDWSQIRPELGLVGCSSFIIANRKRTKGANLEGKSFLHSYDWESDPEFKVLEAIMTAPMIVTTWINLQYYGSTVDNKTYGAGNKTLHNVTAGIGVLEGFTGDLRIGLPWQSINGGDHFLHEPKRLSVVIEAPKAAMNKILDKHTNVKELCDNGWMQLFALNEDGIIEDKYIGGLSWEKVNAISKQETKMFHQNFALN
jgi:uncharacterized protein YbcC (UPF0753/DUF2309 family)